MCEWLFRWRLSVWLRRSLLARRGSCRGGLGAFGVPRALRRLKSLDSLMLWREGRVVDVRADPVSIGAEPPPLPLRVWACSVGALRSLASFAIMLLETLAPSLASRPTL